MAKFRKGTKVKFSQCSNIHICSKCKDCNADAYKLCEGGYVFGTVFSFTKGDPSDFGMYKTDHYTIKVRDIDDSYSDLSFTVNIPVTYLLKVDNSKEKYEVFNPFNFI